MYKQYLLFRNQVKGDMNCRLCKQHSVDTVIDFGMQPIVHNLISTKSLEYDKYHRAVDLCRKCGFVQLHSPIPADILYEPCFAFLFYDITLAENVKILQTDDTVKRTLSLRPQVKVLFTMPI